MSEESVREAEITYTRACLAFYAEMGPLLGAFAAACRAYVDACLAYKAAMKGEHA